MRIAVISDIHANMGALIAVIFIPYEIHSVFNKIIAANLPKEHAVRLL
ncbi:MAG: hypothetical protein WBB70_09865 [Desulfobacterales bacterium]|jgi:hypothetical protein